MSSWYAISTIRLIDQNTEIMKTKRLLLPFISIIPIPHYILVFYTSSYSIIQWIVDIQHIIYHSACIIIYIFVFIFIWFIQVYVSFFGSYAHHYIASLNIHKRFICHTIHYNGLSLDIFKQWGGIIVKKK